MVAASFLKKRSLFYKNKIDVLNEKITELINILENMESDSCLDNLDIVFDEFEIREILLVKSFKEIIEMTKTRLIIILKDFVCLKYKYLKRLFILMKIFKKHIVNIATLGSNYV